ncbi:YqiJ family protein [Sulfurovum sp. bin170]|uniref:OB-fold-containig protein n=1 Tax=Sulfurovum sp. bin170 TaxID=2695268 RepID=UPI0013E08B0B|nr:OB-fold-containig protein [Sulfurovum sp. bin170]NEW60508.1 YqiJ family protein [Sulfurovum sp. bin170]
MEFSAPEMLPYSVAFMIFAIFAVLEFSSMILGWGIFAFLDDIFSIDTDIEAETSLGNFFGFVNPQKVPFSMVLISFFFIFSFLGSLIQNIFGLLPIVLTLPIVLIITVVLLRHTTNIIGRVMPKETTEVVSTDSFLGKKATILDPLAKRGLPARAKIRDIYGESHYIRVEPMGDDDVFKEGDEIILIEKSGSLFLVSEKI